MDDGWETTKVTKRHGGSRLRKPAVIHAVSEGGMNANPGLLVRFVSLVVCIFLGQVGKNQFVTAAGASETSTPSRSLKEPVVAMRSPAFRPSARKTSSPSSAATFTGRTLARSLP
jgi:hypothetical protein